MIRKYSISRYVSIFSFLLTGALIGSVPSIVGHFINPLPVEYKNASLIPTAKNIWLNANYSFEMIFPAVLDAFEFPGLQEAGFWPNADGKVVIKIHQFFCLLLLVLLFFGSIVNILRNRKEMKFVPYEIIFFFILISNIASVILTKNSLFGFGVRYFLPAIFFSVPVFAGMFIGLKNESFKLLNLNRYLLRGFVFLHLLIYVHSYTRGYFSKDSLMYIGEGTPGIYSMIQYLKDKKITHCAMDYWLAAPVVYYTKFDIKASNILLLNSGHVRNPEITKEILDQKEGVNCIAYNFFTPLDAQKTGDILQNKQFRFKILETKDFKYSTIYLVKEDLSFRK